jgi:hypothetical protein
VEFGYVNDLEKLEKLNHARACMLRACEHIRGKATMSQADIIDVLADGMEAVRDVILEEKYGRK